MAGDKTTKRGMGLSEEGQADWGVSSGERESSVEAVPGSGEQATLPGVGEQKNAATRPGVGPSSSKATYFQDAEPSQPVSRREVKQSRGTERGVGNTPPRQISTKPGIAPAPPTSDPPPAPRLEKTPAQPSAAVDEAPGQDVREQFREDQTPAESEYDVKVESDRSQFRTAPGGGKNRVSGGRAAAAAYVSPSTLPPGHGTGRITAAVKVHEAVQQDARTFPTEPSLMRRRESSLPPPMPPGYGEPPPSRAKALIFGGVALCAVGALIGWWLTRIEVPAVASEAPQPAETVPSENLKKIGNAAPARPKPELSATSAHAEKVKPSPAPEDTKTNAPAPAQQKPLAPRAPTSSKQSPPVSQPKPSPKAPAQPRPTPAKKNDPSEEEPWLD